MKFKFEIDDDLINYLQVSVPVGKTLEQYIEANLATWVKDKTHYLIFLRERDELRKGVLGDATILSACALAKEKLTKACPSKGVGSLGLESVK